MKKWIVGLLFVLLMLGLLPAVFAAQVDGTKIDLLYDDRKELSVLLGETATNVTISRETVTSRKVGTEEADAQVLKYENGILYAVGTGTATLTVDGTGYQVTVSPAPLSIFMITGHSIGAGEVGNSAQSVVVEAGQAYSTFRSSSLAMPAGGLGYGSAARPAKIDAFAPGQGGNKGVGSGIAWQWNQLTGEKAWVINMAVSGSCLNEWVPGAQGHHSTYSYHYDTTVEVYRAAQTVLKNEIAAGHYTLGHMVMLYHNGANFGNYPGWTLQSVAQDYDTMWSSYKRDLAIDVDGDGDAETVEALGLIPSWKPSVNNYTLDKAAGYFMSASADYPDIFIASNATRDYLDGDLSGFPDITYTTQSKAVAKPESILHTDQGGTSVNSLFCASDKAHLSQVTYNMVGIDEAENLLAFLRGDGADAKSVKFVALGREEVSHITMGVGERFELAVEATPVPAGGIEFVVTDGLELTYPLVVTATAEGAQSLTAYADGKQLAQVTFAVEAAHSHCVCGGHAKGMTDHSCATEAWIRWGDQENEKTSLPTTTGNYYLVSDICISTSYEITSGQSVNLCLNGFDVDCSDKRFYFSTGDLRVTDCGKEADWGTVFTTNNTNYGGLIYQNGNSSGGMIEIFAGNFDADGTNCWGGILLVDGTSRIYGGNFDGGTTVRRFISDSQGTRDGRGGCFYLMRGKLNIYGGKITGGTAQNAGGNIHVGGGTFTMTGGTVSGGKLNASAGSLTDGAAATGANISINSGAATISGGTVTGGEAPNGGNISVSGGNLTVTGNALIKDGNATGRAGNIYCFGGKLTVSGGTVTGGYAGTSGGNLAAYNPGEILVSGGLIEKGNAGTYGGNISLVSKSTLTVTGGTISGGWIGTSGTSGYGGNIYGGYSSTSSYSTIHITGGTITGGKANLGGNIDFDGTGTISGGLIEKGEAKTGGGNVYRTNRSSCTLTITGGTITGGKSKNGGNLLVYGTADITGGDITNGEASGYGGNLYLSYKAVVDISGGLIAEGQAANGGNIGIYPLPEEVTSNGTTTYKQRNSILNISGGIIRDGYGTSRAGNMFMTTETAKPSRAIVTVTGGTISGGDSADGTNIVVRTCGDYTMTGGTLIAGKEGIRLEMIKNTKAEVPTATIGGDARLDGTGIAIVVDRSYSNSQGQSTLRFEKLTDEFIRVDAVPYGVFATADADYSGKFLDKNNLPSVTYDGATGNLTIAETQPQEPNVAVYNGGALFGEYTTVADAVKVAARGGSNYYIKLKTDITEESTVDGDFWVDLNGCDLAGLTLTGTLYGMDSSTDGYTDEACGKLSVTGSVAVQTKTSLAQTGAVRRYLAVRAEDGSYSFHRFYFGITHVAMRTADGSIGYTATFAGSDTVKAYLDAERGFGLVASVDGAPKSLTDGVAVAFPAADYAGEGVAITKKVLVENIMKDGLTEEELTERGQMMIYAGSFLQTKDGETILSTVQGHSLRTLVETIDNNFNTYPKKNRQELLALYSRYEAVLGSWSLQNLHHTGAEFASATALDQAGFLALLDANKHNSTNCTLPSGTYYLTGDVDLGSRVILIGSGSRVTLCLNGQTLTGNSRILNIFGTLDLYDCCANKTADARGRIVGNSTGLAPVFYSYAGSVFNLHSGDLTATRQVSQGGVGILSHDDSDKTKPASVMNMYGGRIYGGNVTGSGGNLSIFNGGTLRMYGGEIFGGRAGTYGGNIRLGSGTAELLGGRLLDGVAGTYGGNMNVGSADAVLTLGEDMVLSGGTAELGGNLYISASRSVTVGAALLEKGVADQGGNLYVADGTLTFTGTRLEKGAAVNGGNYATKNKGSVTFVDAVFTDGQAEDGGNIYIYKDMYGDGYKGVTTASLTLTDCLVSGGSASHLGGGIYAMESEVILTGATSVTDNRGGNVYLDAGQTLNLKGLAQTSVIGVSMCAPGKITDDTAAIENIRSDVSGLTVISVDGGVVLAGEPLQVPELTGFSVGWSRNIVTSPFPVPLDGMGKNVERMNTYQVVSDLTVSIIVMANEKGLEEAVALCTMDTIVIPEEFSSAIARVISDATGIPADRIFLSGTHTHAAVSLDEIHEATREYLQWLYPRMAGYAREAVEDLAPVSRTEIARTDAAGMNKVRRYVDADGNAYSSVRDTITSDMIPESAVDSQLQLLRFTRYDGAGKDDVIIANWQSHPGHIASASNGNVSPELIGTFREAVEAAMPHTKCAFFQGAAGNQSRGAEKAYQAPDGNSYDLTKVGGFGGALAAHALEAMKSAVEITTGEIRVAHCDFDTEPWYKAGYTGDKTTDMRLSAVSIGQFAFVTAPYEMFSQNGRQIKEFAAENDLFEMVFVIENTGGSNKYIAAYESFANDETDGELTSFEVTSTRFSKGIAEELVTNFARLLAAVSGKTDVNIPDFRAEAAEKYQ